MKHIVGKTLENQIFTWGGWDEVECGVFSFTDCALIVPVGSYGPMSELSDFPMGHKFPLIVFDTQKSEMRFYVDDSCEECLTYQLHLTVGRRL